MARHYTPRLVLRHLPRPRFNEYLAADRVPFDLADDPDDPDALYAAWLRLRPEHRDRVEQMFRAVHDLADADGVRMLTEEAVFQRRDLTAVPADDGFHAQALWFLVHLPTVFHHTHQVFAAWSQSTRYWHKVAGLPADPPDTSPAARNRLARDLAAYFREEQCRGQRVTVEHYLRAGRDHYFFCYPDDYTHTFVGHNDAGHLRRSPVRPAFEVVFVFTPADGTLDTYAPGPRAVRARLRDLFCGAVLGALPPPQNPRKPEYQLDRLFALAGGLPVDPAGGVTAARVHRLRVAVPSSGRRAVLEGDPAAGPGDVFAFLDERFPRAEFDRGVLHLVQATIELTYRPAGADRDRSFRFDVGYPDGCSLKNKSDEERVLGEKCLKAWGVAGG